MSDRVHFVDYRASRTFGKKVFGCEFFWDQKPEVRLIHRPAASTDKVDEVTCRACRRSHGFRVERNQAWHDLFRNQGSLITRRKRRCRGRRAWGTCRCVRHLDMTLAIKAYCSQQDVSTPDEVRTFPMHRTRPARPHLVKKEEAQ